MEGVIALEVDTDTVALAIALITRGGGRGASLVVVSVVSFEETDECSDS